VTKDELVAKIAVAISEMEGFPKKGSRAQRQNNPGNLRRWGKTPVVEGFANFPTLAEGWAALQKQVAKNVGRGLSLYEFFGGKPGVYPGYAPDTDGNHSRNYAEYVAKRVKIPADVPLNKIESCPTCGRAYGGD
jgi:hypothetical protein